MGLPDPSGHRDVALGLCRDEHRVLLVLNARSAQGMATRFWDLPGGSVEPGEGLRGALAREWEEEVGWRPTVGDLLLVVDGRKRTASDAAPLYTWRTFVFDVALPAFGVFPVAGAEIDRVELVRTPEALLRLSAPYHAPLRRFLRGEGGRHADVEWIEPVAAAATPALPAALRHLLVLAAAAAEGDADLVGSTVSAARAEGVASAHLEEALLQIVPYAGFPRALSAFAAARSHLGPVESPPDDSPSEEAPPDERATRGFQAFQGVYGATADRVLASLEALHPLLPTWTVEFAYGRVLARPALDLPTRELLAVAILTALGRAGDALLGHMRAAVRLGASPETVAAAVAVVPSSAGTGKRAAARALLARL